MKKGKSMRKSKMQNITGLYHRDKSQVDGFTARKVKLQLYEEKIGNGKAMMIPRDIQRYPEIPRDTQRYLLFSSIIIS